MTQRSAEQAAVEHGLRSIVRVEGRDDALHTLAERMERYRVPGASIAVVDGGEIAWAAGYGHTWMSDHGRGEAVTPTTRFQAASISKMVTSLAALALVDDGVVDLDGDVNQWLRRWRVPDNELTRAQPVTLRHLLNHTAGTTVPSFIGYVPGAPLPTLEQILRGEPPANEGPLTVDLVPGTATRYSGGGTTVVQLLMEDASGEPFTGLVDDLVLTPAGMTDTVFDQPLTAERAATAARGHDTFGTVVPGGMWVYPELAAAGMWTTAIDLARLAVAVGDTTMAAGRSTALLSPEIARQAVTPVEPGGRGLIGTVVDVDPAAPGAIRQYAHDGANVGYRARIEGFVGRASGLVVLTNGDGGAALIGEVRAAVAAAHVWPDPVTRHLAGADVPASVLDRYAGRYVDQQGGEIALVHDDGVLFVPSIYGRRELVPIDHARFLDDETGSEVVFTVGADSDGGDVGITVFHEGHPILSYARRPAE